MEALQAGDSEISGVTNPKQPYGMGMLATKGLAQPPILPTYVYTYIIIIYIIYIYIHIYCRSGCTWWSLKKIRTVAATRCRTVYSICRYMYIYICIQYLFDLLTFVQKVPQLEVLVEFWKVRRVPPMCF